jgi:allose kinase
MPATVVLDVGGTHIRIGHVMPNGPGLTHDLQLTEALRQAEPIRFLTQVIEDYVARQGLTLSGVVIGLPVSFDSAMERALSSPNIPNLEQLSLAVPLSQRLGCPVWLERDIVLLLMGEWHAGAVQGASSVLGVFWGTGIGGAFLQAGRPYRGASGGAVEVGHLPIRFEGRRCVCGNTDCLEAYASGHVLRELALAAREDLASIFQSSASRVQARLERLVHDCACAVASAVNILDPAWVVIGGGIPQMAGFPKEYFRSVVYTHLRRPLPAEALKFGWASLGWQAALHGAVWLKALREEEHVSVTG